MSGAPPASSQLVPLPSSAFPEQPAGCTAQHSLLGLKASLSQLHHACLHKQVALPAQQCANRQPVSVCGKFKKSNHTMLQHMPPLRQRPE